jgi:hypothetical protein
MISAYTTAFNLEDMKLSLKEALFNWFVYFDEVVISTRETDLGDVKSRLANFSLLHKVKIVSLDIGTEDLHWDGKLKNNGLQNCSHNVVFQIDLDERIAGSQPQLNQLAEAISRSPSPCSISIQNIDLFGDLNHYKTMGRKWYLHSRGGCYRGAVNFARIDNEIFDPEKSDTCELIDENGDLIPCIGTIRFTIDSPKVFHLGFLDLERRAHLNQTFWKDIWSERKSLSQQKEVEATDVFIDAKKFDSTPKYKHNIPLPLWPTIQ